MNEQIRQYVQAWLSKANSDLRNAEIILAAETESPPLDTVCFHCQQDQNFHLCQTRKVVSVQPVS